MSDVNNSRRVVARAKGARALGTYQRMKGCPLCGPHGQPANFADHIKKILKGTKEKKEDHA